MPHKNSMTVSGIYSIINYLIAHESKIDQRKINGRNQSSMGTKYADGFKPTLVICFISKSLDRKAISELLDEAGIAVFGCTTNGEFINEVTGKGSAAVLLLDMNKDHLCPWLACSAMENWAGQQEEIWKCITSQPVAWL